MIQNLSINQHDVSDKVHDLIRDKLLKMTDKLKGPVTKSGCGVLYPIKTMREVSTYYGIYGTTRCNIIMLSLDFSDFDCSYADFPAVLCDSCRQLYGDEIMSDYPALDQAVCDYIEYVIVKPVENSDSFLKLLTNNGKFKPEQLNRDKWDKYKCSWGVIKFLLCKENDTNIKMIARCTGTSLKARIKDQSVHRDGGVIVSAAVNQENEVIVFNWLFKKYKLNF